MTDSFNNWFALYLDQDKEQVINLLNDKTATQFLITWSIFESNCFNGFLRVNEMKKFSEKTALNKNYKKENFSQSLKYFHNRYQDMDLKKNLLHKSEVADFSSILQKDIQSLSPSEEIFFLVVVVYRYRNNIFHGNKGVASWLKYKIQIDKCSIIMQSLIDLKGAGLDKKFN